ncbi:MAG: 4-(cytidine 5'-diphospho)-2-C-methyl-D-erythritol kinase [Planctomycetes bacterium]|nr:4-(cytidine 5'-diphospho)-2-C-methyl-D-erythritol kinase [Planctomycetota bacterium]
MLRRWQLPAKLNWTLEVLGRRPDGFHELRSWFLAVGQGDRLGLELGAGVGIELSGPCALGVPDDPRNLVLRAEAAWRSAGGQAPGARWSLEKRLPAGSGLGAGSADAAGALHALEAVASRPLGVAACRALAAGLGSDVPFFVDGRGAELRGGRGEQLLARATPPRGSLVIAWPAFPVATAAVFAALGAPLLRPDDAREARGAALPPEPGSNDLEAAADSSHPALGAFAETLRQHGRFCLSGSGGAHFCVCPGPAEAKGVVAGLQRAGIDALVTAALATTEPQELPV